MTPERLAELKEQAVLKSFVPVESWELLDLLAAVEREAKLRELRSRVERLVGQCDPDSEHGLVIGLRAALETKGGE